MAVLLGVYVAYQCNASPIRLGITASLAAILKFRTIACRSFWGALLTSATAPGISRAMSVQSGTLYPTSANPIRSPVEFFASIAI